MIDIVDLSFSYPNQELLKKINLSVREGDFVLIIGSNGAGKSTLIKLILCEMTPTAGEIRIFGKKGKKDMAIADLAYVAQDGLGKNSNFPASVFECVAASLTNKLSRFLPMSARDKAKVLHSLETVGMEDYKDRPISELSGGQRRRVLLAKALAQDSKLLILDEPTSGVDVESAKGFYELLSKLNKEKGLTIVMITHELEKVHGYASSTYCLDMGYLLKLSDKEIEDELAHRHVHPPLGK